jgi:hypothetical protein
MTGAGRRGSERSSMSVSSVAVSSLATTPAPVEPTAPGGSGTIRGGDDRPARPAPDAASAQNDRQPPKAPLPPKVGQAIDISV